MIKHAKRRARAPIILLALAVLLAAALPLCAPDTTVRTTFSAAVPLPTGTEPPDARAAFLKARANTRDKERAALCALVEGEASEALKKGAEELLLSLSACAAYETRIETALCGMNLTGLSSVNEKSAYVFVDQALTQRQAALLFSLVAEITGYAQDMIRVSDGNGPGEQKPV